MNRHLYAASLTTTAHAGGLQDLFSQAGHRPVTPNARWHRVAGLIWDGLLLMLIVYSLPVAILAVGMPLALLIWLVSGLAKWL